MANKLTPLEQELEDNAIKYAIDILDRRINQRPVINLNDPHEVKQYLILKFAQLEHEVFGIIYLDIKNRLIGVEQVFRGTIDNCTIHPREIVKEGLAKNATSTILFHNHPSGTPEPSEADFTVTQRLSDALHLVGINVVDHIIVAGTRAVSFSETGMITRIKRPL